MSVLPEKISDHQRILITGPRGAEILEICRKVLSHHGRPFDLITPDEESVGAGPIVLIFEGGAASHYEPHIALIDSVPKAEKAEYKKIADGIPKAGTVVYNLSDSLAKEIGSQERPDVHREEYGEDTPLAAARKLLKRIAISDAQFNEVNLS